MAVKIKTIEVDGREIKVGESYYRSAFDTSYTVEAIDTKRLQIELAGEDNSVDYIDAEDFWTEYRPE